MEVSFGEFGSRGAVLRKKARSRDRIGGFLASQIVVAGILLALAGIIVSPASAAEGERVFEPRLSLIGGCKEESLDNVEDPGCPTTPPAGPHPPAFFSDPRAVTTDDFGNIYISSFGSAGNGSKGRIDVFCSDGTFASELVTPGPTSLAVDSKGNLYVYSSSAGELIRFAPSAPYQPETCGIQYSTPPVTVKKIAPIYSGLAINRDNDHLFADFGSAGVVEYSAATEGNVEVRSVPGPAASGGAGMAVDATRDRMYASAGKNEERIDIYDLNTVEGTPPNDKYKVIGSILPSSVPAKDFGTQLSIAVDEGNGHVFVLDGENTHLYEFTEAGNYLSTIQFPFERVEAGQIGVDNGTNSPNGKGSEEAGEGRFLYVPSNRTGIGHSYAFFESTVGAPEVKSTAAVNVSEDEAELQAQINPKNLETTYVFEYKVEGAENWTPAGEGTLPVGNSVAEASAAATGLTPETSYRFRVIATNEEGSDEAEGSFATYPSVATETSSCANGLLRVGPSALLPDCRAYELVTPADTNARAPLGVGNAFVTRQVSPVGDKVPFRVEGGALPGLGGTGSLVGDPYLATRTNEGWSTAYTGPSAEEASQIVPGTTSPDQGYSFYIAGDQGSAVLAENTGYVRYPDGRVELLGQGSIGKIDPESSGRLISENGTHIVFSTGSFGSPTTAVQIEPLAAPDGTPAIYDRTPDGVTHVISLKPGDESFGTGESAVYQGASLDGAGIAFAAGSTLYLRYDNSETFVIGTGVDFAGVAEGGSRVFYMDGGDLKAFDIDEGVIDFSASGNVTPVTVAGDGATAFFVSPSVLGGANPQGDSAQAGEENLYRSVEGQIDFVATVTERDVEGDVGLSTDGLGLWMGAVSSDRFGRVPARSTPDGSVFLFKSRAALTGYDPEGKAEIYRYDPAAEELQCLSCNPTGAPASSDATLQSETREGQTFLSQLIWPENLRADGRRAFFESSEALVASDSDGLRDVYEWEDQGVGSCTRPEGCVYLVSSPQSRKNEYLWAVSRSGDDVFFLSSELLAGSDADETPSIYDARVGGGFAEEAVSECQGEGCRPQLSPTPLLPSSDTRVRGSAPPKTCPKGRHKVKRNGKVSCVKNKKPQKKKGAGKNRAGAGKKGGRR